MAKLDLFGGDSDAEENDQQQEKEAKIKINTEFAKRLAHNKEREALHRLQELKKKGLAPSDSANEDDDDDEDDEEEDEDGIITKHTELQFYETLKKIKLKDPSIYQGDVKLFQDDAEERQVQGGGGGEDKKKTLYLKDVVAKQLLEQGPDLDDEDDNANNNGGKRHLKSYAEEQDTLKRAFIEAAPLDADDDEGLLALKKKNKKSVVEEEEDMEIDGDSQAKDGGIAERLNEYFGNEDELDDNDKFLKDFLLNKGWMDKQTKPRDDDDLVGISTDEEELENQERFEAHYNFRFEDGAGDQVLGHPRFPEGSIRKKANARSVQRTKKQERMEIAEFERKEELKHLKNVKKKEIFEKLEKIRSVAGLGSVDEGVIGEEDIEEEFDPEEYDRKMKEAFGEGYYGADDPETDFHAEDEDYLEKPNFDAEDDLLGLPKGWDGRKPDGFAAVREKVKHKQAQNCESFEGEEGEVGEQSSGEEKPNNSESSEEEKPNNSESSEEEESDEDIVEELITRDTNLSDQEGGSDIQESLQTKKKKRGRISLREKLALDKQLEEYYKLDYEDVIGDIRTRFKYRQVHPNNYGLKTKEILMADDKELNQYVSLKKLAPYCSEEWKANKKQWVSQKKRRRMAVLNPSSNHGKKQKKSSDKQDIMRTLPETSSVQNVETAEEYAADVGIKKRRRKKNKGPVIAPSRMSTYRLPSSKKKKKTSVA